MDFPTSGKIGQGLIGSILASIHYDKFSGTLGLTKESIKKVISFSNGKPISARSNVLKESIGGILVASGKLTQTELDEIIKEVKSAPGRKIGDVLILRKIVTSVELNGLLKKQLIPQGSGAESDRLDSMMQM